MFQYWLTKFNPTPDKATILNDVSTLVIQGKKDKVELCGEQMGIHFDSSACVYARVCVFGWWWWWWWWGLLLNGSAVSLIKGVNKGPVLSNPQG